MRQARPQDSVQVRAEYGAREDDEDRPMPGTCQGQHRSRARSRQGPAETEQRAARGVPDEAAVFRRDADELTAGAPPAGAAEQPQAECCHGNRGADDAEHVERIEPEHFLGAVPARDFGLDGDEAEESAEQQVRNELQQPGCCPVRRDQASDGRHCAPEIRGMFHQAPPGAKMRGNSTCVITRPPAKNPNTAMSDGSCRLARPVIACPEVQPPAQRAPKPTSPPPRRSRARVSGCVNTPEPNSSGGRNAPRRLKAGPSSAAVVAAAGSGPAAAGSNGPARRPPAMTPAANMRFQPPWRRQSYRKKLTFVGSIAQACRRLLLTPNALFPSR